MVTRKEYALTNYFLPGYWPHAALYLGTPTDLEGIGVQADHPNVLPRWDALISNGTPQRVLEALADGVRLRPVDSAFSVDALCVIRPNLPDDKIAEALMRGLGHEGKAYDFDFDFTHPERLVCTEVVYRSYEGITPEWNFKLNRRAGRLTLSAEDLLKMASDEHLFHVEAVYCPTQAKEVLSGDPAVNLLKKTVIST